MNAVNVTVRYLVIHVTELHTFHSSFISVIDQIKNEMFIVFTIQMYLHIPLYIIYQITLIKYSSHTQCPYYLNDTDQLALFFHKTRTKNI